MSGNQLVETNELWLRITDLGYKDISKEEFAQEVERIYIEETGKPLKGEISVVRSSEIDQIVKDENSSYDGTAIHIYSKEQDVNEMYVVSQGTTNADDWLYNIRAMQAGVDTAQADSTNTFVKEAQKEFKERASVEEISSTIGLSHSLAHNNNTVSQLLNGNFDEVYSVNGAQSTYFQLYKKDFEFRDEVNKKFNISSADSKAIYSLPQDELKTFAEAYYKEKGTVIHQVISSDDPLNALANIRGFFTLGDVTMIDTNPDKPGLKAIIDKIPDSEVKSLQDFALVYAEGFQNGGNNQGIEDLTGVNMDVVDKIMNDGVGAAVGTYFSKDLDDMISDVNKKVPPLLEKVTNITSNADVIFGELKNAGYITNAQKQVAVEELANIEKSLKIIEEKINSIDENRKMSEEMMKGTKYSPYAGQAAMASGFNVMAGDVDAAIAIYHEVQNMQASAKRLHEELGSVMEEIIASHGIIEMLNALGASKNQGYLGNDLVLMTGGNQEIKVNISAAVRMYQEGQQELQKKKTYITKIAERFQEHIIDDYENQKQKVLSDIRNIETNPCGQLPLLRKHVFLPYFSPVQIDKVEVTEQFNGLSGMDISHLMEGLTKSLTDNEDFLESTKSNIEQLFSKDRDLSILFNYVPGG
ncbi:DUF6792 domain-containing protein [Priestia flexa]|uniref:DUF6792 domain-containing protein n=1 Tax=Priestia flexa TaxID=86664 RepID=A0ABU4JAI3_9BACI|nr:DUF6792 domain-containing protein [Priestia flexa]MCG7314663.1 hypothetical protein [Priestia flexa]MDW8517910.1 DUF6792 domain-containing protein [Priestia flexa]